MTVAQLQKEMTARELDQWAIYFDLNPSEANMTDRLELSVARLTAGMCGGEVRDHLQLSERQKFELDSQEIRKTLNPNGD